MQFPEIEVGVRAGVYCAGFRLECISSHEQTGLKSLRSYTFTGNLEYGKAGRKKCAAEAAGTGYQAYRADGSTRSKDEPYSAHLAVNS